MLFEILQGRARKNKAAITFEIEASENPTLESVQPDPTLVCTAYKKNRFFLFSRREPEDTRSHEAERDVFNEKPSKEDIISATEGQSNFIRNILNLLFSIIVKCFYSNPTLIRKRYFAHRFRRHSHKIILQRLS